MIKKNNERKEALFRIIVLIISGIILGFWRYLIWVLALINWVVTLFFGKRDKELALFCEYYNTETYRYIKYLTSVTNERPFPFNKMQRVGKFE